MLVLGSVFLTIFTVITVLYFILQFLKKPYLLNHFTMEPIKGKFQQSLSFKGITIVLLILCLLIPSTMIQNLIEERQQRSHETIEKISDKWSQSQTLCAPLLIVPYTTTLLDKKNNPYQEEHVLYVTPKNLKITAALTPEERHYGIFKAILYKSNLHFSGNFADLDRLKIEKNQLHFDKAYIAIGLTDLRGVTQNPSFTIGNKTLETTVGKGSLFLVEGKNELLTLTKTLIVELKDMLLADNLTSSFNFDYNMKLNGSSALNFIPIGQQTSVVINGQWQSPSFIGSFSPESTIENGYFKATWNILSFNRDIPNTWSDGMPSMANSSFGVNLIETVNHYQLNMRSAKYSLMFIALTFILFFFVELFTSKPIHFFQYVLVGIALVLFYSLLLSFSEQIGFSWAYLVASAATISLITVYFYSLIHQKVATLILAGTMILLYSFLYIILQLEDFALLFGSIFLFVILGVIMFVSNKIKLNQTTANPETKE